MNTLLYVLNIYISCFIAPHCNFAVDKNGFFFPASSIFYLDLHTT